MIIETNDLSDFFEEYLVVRNGELAHEEVTKAALAELAQELADPEQEIVERFVDNQEFRRSVLTTLSRSPIQLISGFISLLDKCIDETWQRSARYGAFHGYAQNLVIILDILTAFEVSKIPPALFQTAAYALHRVAPFVGRELGESWAAANTWDGRKGELSAELLVELKSAAMQNRYSGLQRLLRAM